MAAVGDGGSGDHGADPRSGPALAPRPGLVPGRAPSARRVWTMPVAGWLSRTGARLVLPRDWLAASYAAEMAADNQFSWYVVAYAGGAAIYLLLPAEPSFLALSLVLVVSAAALVACRRRMGPLFGATLCVMCVAGVWTGSLKAIRADAPRLDHERIVVVSGWVIDEETVLKGAIRTTLKVASMTGRGLPASAIPDRITVTFRASTPAFPVGTGIRFLAKLRPLDGPVMPGGYDFGRRAYFDGRGATGYALGKVERADLGPPEWPMRVTAAIADLRHRMSQRIRAGLPGAEGAIAAAIIVGEQRGIPDAENDAIRMAGLPHMITIAGLHMSIVAGCVFIAVRWLLALIPAISLRFPIKKWAAAAALVVTTFYMLVSGAHLSAERAYLMGAIMLLAVLCGRPALTMRNLGLAALVLVARDPNQVVEPGFLMSFLAVMALISAYQAYWRYRASHPGAPDHGTRSPLGSVLRGVARHGLGTVTSTLIATAATASVTADQFFRVPPYGAISNMVVLPFIEMVAMPAAVLACLAMPFGLEVIPLMAMGWAIDVMNGVGSLAAKLPGGNGLVGSIHPWSNALAIAGITWVCLWQRAWRLLGILPIVVAIALAPFGTRPDILIGPDASPVAVRGPDGQLKVLGAPENRFATAIWLTADAAPTAPADPRAPLDGHIADGWRCDPLGCQFELAATPREPLRRIAVVTDARGFEEDCSRADVVITRLVAPADCTERSLVFDRVRLARSGAVALTLRHSTIAPTVSKPLLGQAAAPGDDAAEPDDARASLNVDITVALSTGQRAWMPAPTQPTSPDPVRSSSPPNRNAAVPRAVAQPARREVDRLPGDEDTIIDAAPTSTGPLAPTHARSPQQPPRQGVARPPDLLPFDPTDPPDLPDP